LDDGIAHTFVSTQCRRRTTPAGRETGGSVLCAYATRSAGDDPGDVWRNLQENRRVADWVWGEKSMGWHYDLTLVIITTNGGPTS
jgi:hypothetical protein